MNTETMTVTTENTRNTLIYNGTSCHCPETGKTNPMSPEEWQRLKDSAPLLAPHVVLTW